MAITTPALAAMNTVELMPQAYAYANGVLQQQEGIDPLLAFADTEVQRHHYALAAGFQHDVARLQTLAALAFHDRLAGDHMLAMLSDAIPSEQAIAIDFDASKSRSHYNIPSVCKYVTELRILGGAQ